MVKKVTHGINGVLRTLLEDPVTLSSEKSKRGDAECHSAHHRNQHNNSRSERHLDRSLTRARLGRPPTTESQGSMRQKVTFRIRPDLIDAYRDQSWEARGSLSRLVEKAMSEYRRQFRD